MRETCRMKSVIIPLDSREGIQLLDDVTYHGQYQPSLHQIFCKQIEGSNCGIQAIALVMSAARLKPGREYKPSDMFYTEKNLFTFKQTVDAIGTEKENQRRGMSLHRVAKVMNHHLQNSTNIYHTNNCNQQRFRDIARAALVRDSSSGVIVNFSHSAMGHKQKWWGHHTPLGAYHAASDRFLVLDVGWGSGHYWITSEDLYACMDTVDGGSGKHRGFCVYTRKS